jgi:hypothetical protein
MPGQQLLDLDKMLEKLPNHMVWIHHQILSMQRLKKEF